MKTKKERKHSLCEKNAILAMILTVPLGLLSEAAAIVPGAAGCFLSGVAATAILILFNKWFSPEFEGVFKPDVALKETVIIASPMAVVIISAVILNIISSGFYFRPSIYSLCLAVMAGFCEETAFRAMMTAIGMKYLKGNNRPWTIVIISSIIFGLVHIANLMSGADLMMTIAQTFMAICAGFVLAAIYLRSGSIIPGIITHMLYDFINFITDPTIGESGVVNTPSEDSQTFIIVSLIIFSALLAFVGLFMIRKSKIDDIEKIWQNKWNNTLPDNQ